MSKSPWANNGGRREGSGRPKKLKNPRSVYIESDQYDRLKLEALRREKPISEIIRQAIACYVKDYLSR